MAKRTSSSGGRKSKSRPHRSMDLVMAMMAVPGKSCEEGRIADWIIERLCEAGAPRSAITTDTAHHRSPHGGEVGNLIFKLPGTRRGSRRMLMAHIDTVPLCVGSRPVRRGAIVEAADPDTALGADDRAGAAVVLNAALTLLRGGHSHAPLTFLWPIQEEIGLNGARYGSLGKLGNPKLCFNFDGGSPSKLTVGATGAYRLEIEVKGIASHAGVAPEMGASAIAIAGLAIAALHRDGWHGDIVKGKRNPKRGTSNIGVIQGGDATNVVTDRVRLRAEARSHDKAFRERIVKEIEKAFKAACREVKTALGKTGSVQLTATHDYEAFQLAANEPCVLEAERAVCEVGLEPLRAIANGGLDANWTSQRGLPTVSLGCGQRNAHTVKEQLDVVDFENACKIAIELATG